MNVYQTGIALLVLLLGAACDKAEYDGIPADGEPQPIRFDIAVATATPSGPSTRVSTATDFTSSFTAGDQVGLYIVNGDGGLQSSDNWVDNALLTFDGTKWTCDLPAGKEYYPRDGSKLSFYAYYPYDSEVTDPLNMSFSVQKDQSAGLSSSYLMTASKKGVSKSHNPVQLTFSHKLAMVKVNLINGQQAHNIAPGPADVVTLKGLELSTLLNLATDVVVALGDTTDIKMHYNTTDQCWYALVPRQGVDKSSKLLTFEWAHILTLRHKPGAGFDLPVGEVKPLDITIDAKMDIDPNHVYAVGDAYPYVGFDKKGVVFEVSDDGKSGKIISRKRWPDIAWSTETVELGADNRENGRVNMATVMKHDATFANYPAFSKVHKLNTKGTYTDDSKGIWYLPAADELKQMYKNTEKVGHTLEALGLEIAFPWGYAWSSTERAAFNPQRDALIIFLSSGSVTYDTKTNTESDGGKNHVWPIMAF